VQIGTTSFPIVWSIIGSALFVAVITLLTRRSYWKRSIAPRRLQNSEIRDETNAKTEPGGADLDR